MKIKLLFFLLLFSSFSENTFSQNWSPINISDKFNYKLDNSSYITNTIWQDSTKLINSDSVFYLNRIMCDTCATCVGCIAGVCDTCYGLRNQPQFFGSRIIKMQNGIYNFRDYGDMVINSLSNLSNSWLFDSIQNINAQVVIVGTENIFGNNDSVKTILLSTGDTVKISKNFGILLSPNNYGQNSYYRLVGIEGRNLGTLTPKFFEYFDFNVGDMFEYIYWWWTQGQYAYSIISKYTIISKQVYPDSIDYQVQGFWKRSGVNTASGCYPFPCYGTISFRTFIEKNYSFSNRYNNSLMDFWTDSATNCGMVSMGPQYDFIKISYDTNGILSKSFGYGNPLMGSGLLGYNLFSPSSDTMLPLLGLSGMTYTEIYKIGLGQTDYICQDNFENGSSNHLTAYRKGNDTVGFFTPDGQLTSVGENIISSNISVFPNPSNGIFTIKTEKEKINSAEIYNVFGKKVYAELVSASSSTINISSQPNGIYFLQLKTSEGVANKKIIIQK